MSGYAEKSSSALTSIVVVVPLALIYEVVLFLVSPGATGSVPARLWWLAGILGRHGILLFLVGMGGYLTAKYPEIRSAISLKLFLILLAESFLYALLLVYLVKAVMGKPALGAGEALNVHHAIAVSLYDEVIFRLLTVGGLYLVFRRVAGAKELYSSIFAVVLGSALYALLYFVAPGGESLATSTFIFRFVGGVIMSALFVLRGFGIVFYSHFFYCLLLLQG